MAFRGLVIAYILFLAVTSAFAKPGGAPPGGGQGRQGGSSDGPGGPSRPGTSSGLGGPGGHGGPDGPGGELHGPPLNLAAVGTPTADVGARLNSCSVDHLSKGRFHLAVFKNTTGNYNLLLEASLANVTDNPPDSLAIVKGAACDAAATTVLSLPVAAGDWKLRAGWWLLHSKASLDAFLENADAATVEALLAVLPAAPAPPTQNGGSAGAGSTGGAGRRMGLELRAAGKKPGKKPGGQKQGGQQQGGQQQGGQQQGGEQKPPAVSEYAVLAVSSAAGVKWGGELMGVKIPSSA